MTELETSMVMLMKVFDKYACSEGKNDTLSKGELKQLLEKELPGMLQGAKGKEDCDKLVKDLDHNGDQQVDFQEFLIFVATLTCLVHDKFQKCAKK